MDAESFFAALTDLTDDSSFDNAMEQLYLISKVEQGLKQVAEGQLIEQQTAWEEVRQWLA